MKFPITVQSIKFEGSFGMKKPLFHADEVGCFVAVRPCSDDAQGKTFLGILLGDLPMGVSGTFDRESGVLTVEPGAGNPAIWVPDLKRVVMGYESWWGTIASAEDLRQITDADINNVWYVQAIKLLAGEGHQPEPPAGSEPVTAGAIST